MDKKPVYGIWVKPDTTYKGGLGYYTEIGVFRPKHSRDWKFFTNENAHNAIGQHTQMVGKKIGEISFDELEKKQLLKLTYFYPFGSKYFEGLPEQTWLKGLGLGAGIFYSALKDVVGVFPKHKIAITDLPQQDMKRMCSRIGIRFYRNYTPKMLLDRTGDYLALQMRQRSAFKTLRRKKSVPITFFYPHPKSIREKRIQKRRQGRH